MWFVSAGLFTGGSFFRFFRPQSRNASFLCKKLVYSQHGNPEDVVTLAEEEIDDNILGNEVLVRMMAAPLHPADINTVQGRYPSEASPQSFPAVLGNEGLGEVQLVGSQVNDMQPGDWVIPYGTQSGTCRSYLRTTDDQLIKIRKSMPLLEAATMAVNPCTAYRLLHDFVYIDENDVVIQNAANSAVARAVIQLCHRLRIHTVNVVRDRPNLDQLIDDLTHLGATRVVTEEQLRRGELFADNNDNTTCEHHNSSTPLRRPVLALDAVGGRSAAELCRQLGEGGTLVTYGAMSRAPLTIPAARLIFGGVRVRGFWLTRWTRRHQGSMQRWEMLDQIQSLCTNRRLHVPPHRCVLIDNYKEALSRVIPPEGRVEAKQIIVFERSLVTRDK